MTPEEWLEFKSKNAIPGLKFHDEQEPPQGRHLPYGHRSKLLARPAIEEGEWAHLTNRQQSDNSRAAWAKLTPEQRKARAAKSRENGSKEKG